jgi:hypothetical protein
MADKTMAGMPGMEGGSEMPPSKDTDPTKDQHGIDTPPPAVHSPGALMTEGMKNMPLISPARVWTVTGTEDWSLLTGFGAATPMVNMINEMMVAGSPMQGMKMGKMNYEMTEIPAPTPEEARVSPAKAPPSDQPPAVSVPVAPASLKVQTTLVPNPPQVGSANLLTVTVTDADGAPCSDATVACTVVMVTMDMGTTHPTFHSAGGGKYQAKIGFAMAGPWRVTLDVSAPNKISQTDVLVFSAK